jgi:DNA (cytosine-5)-methyltransferase 1
MNPDNRIRVLSLFSGAGGLDLGLERAGMDVVALCEIEPKARAVLRHHWPDTPIYNDVQEVTRERLTADGVARPDLVAGGSPCQDLSVAGRRAGLSGGRSGLFWEQVRIADEYQADLLWENVVGALSSNGGADFAAVLWGISGALPDVPAKGKWSKSGVVVGPKRVALWRVLDAQRFGVPQRRRRVYVVGCSREVAPWFAALLFELQGSGGDFAPSDAPGTGLAGAVELSAGTTSAGTSGSGSSEGSGGAATFVKVIRSGARDAEGNLPPEVWREEGTHPTLNTFDVGDSRTAVVALQDPAASAFSGAHGGETEQAATLLAHGVRLNYANETFIMQEPEIANTLTPNVRGTNNEGNTVVQYAQAPSTTEPDVAGTLGGRIGGRLDIDTAGAYVIGEAQAFSGAHGGETELAATLLANRRMDYETETFITQDPEAAFFALQPDDQRAGKGALRAVTTEVAPTIGCGDHHSDRGLRIVQSPDSVALPALVRMREGKPGGGKGPLISEQSSLTLATGNDQVLFQEKNTTSATGTVTHSLTASSSKGTTEDGTGRGVPIVSQETAVWPELIGTLTTAFDGKNYSNIQEVLSGSVVLSEGPSEDD